MIPPLTFTPVYQPYLWGGDWIRSRLRPNAPEGVLAESWEVSAHLDGMGVVNAGPLAGQRLADLVATRGEELTGPGFPLFPLLVKILDARLDLSLQVHPDNEGARKHGGEPKTEMWHILDAEPGAKIYADFIAGVGPDDVARACKHGRLVQLMQAIPARPGDSFFIPGGRVHAIGAGCRILEIQQSSNTTYRLDDWGRVGPDGKPRPLQIEQGMKVIGWSDHRATRVLPGLIQERRDLRRWVLLESPFFRLEKIEVTGVWSPQERGPSFEILFASKGDLTVENPAGTVSVPRGGSVLVPAQPREFGVNTRGKQAEILRVTVPAARG